jgi:hypothetical protein
MEMRLEVFALLHVERQTTDMHKLLREFFQFLVAKEAEIVDKLLHK